MDKSVSISKKNVLISVKCVLIFKLVCYYMHIILHASNELRLARLIIKSGEELGVALRSMSTHKSVIQLPDKLTGHKKNKHMLEYPT